MPTLAQKLAHRWRSYQQKQRLEKTFKPLGIQRFIDQNRHTCAQVDQWITADTLAGSIFNYGISPGMEPLLNEPIDQHITYTDILALLAAHLQQPVSYLEIGVSVGKNFLQMAHAIQAGTPYGFDIEEINPAIERFFQPVQKQTWPSNSPLKKSDASLKTYRCGQNNLYYLCSDEFDHQGWQRLQGQQFNLIFSDALHEPKALRQEFEKLVELNLLHPTELVMLWDDLGGEMETVFHEHAQLLSRRYPSLRKYQFVTNGWMNLKVHPIGIVSTISL